MNPKMMQFINQIKSIKNPQQAAMNALQQAASQGNPMAGNILKNIQSGNKEEVEQTLKNFMNEQGINLSDLKNMFK